MADNARVTRQAVEVLNQGGNARVTRQAVEVLNQGGNARVTRQAVEVLSYIPPPQISVTLVDGSGNPLANLTGLVWAWFEEAGLPTTAPAKSGTSGTTDANGVFSFDLPLTGLTAGQEGTLILQTPDASRSAIVNYAV